MAINYEERVCPTFLSALTQGLTVTAMGSLLFIVLYSLVNVACGLIKRHRRGQPLDSRDAQKDVGSYADMFPSASSNFR